MVPESDSSAIHDSSQSEMMGEMCILVDEGDNYTGSETKLSCHNGEGLRHRAFSVLIFDNIGRLLIQKRSEHKITFPGVWANSCCSHPLDTESEREAGQGAINAAKRKMTQELGITSEESNSWDFHHMGRMEYSCRWDDEWIEREIDHILIVS